MINFNTMEKSQTSKLEQEVSPVDALEVLLRLGNNQLPLIDIRNQRSIPAMEEVMLHLREKGLVYGFDSEKADKHPYELRDGIVPCFFNDPRIRDIFVSEITSYRERIGFDIRFGVMWSAPDPNPDFDKYGHYIKLVANSLEGC